MDVRKSTVPLSKKTAPVVKFILILPSFLVGHMNTAGTLSTWTYYLACEASIRNHIGNLLFETELRTLLVLKGQRYVVRIEDP